MVLGHLSPKQRLSVERVSQLVSFLIGTFPVEYVNNFPQNVNSELYLCDLYSKSFYRDSKSSLEGPVDKYTRLQLCAPLRNPNVARILELLGTISHPINHIMVHFPDNIIHDIYLGYIKQIISHASPKRMSFTISLTHPTINSLNAIKAFFESLPLENYYLNLDIECKLTKKIEAILHDMPITYIKIEEGH